MAAYFRLTQSLANNQIMAPSKSKDSVVDPEKAEESGMVLWEIEPYDTAFETIEDKMGSQDEAVILKIGEKYFETLKKTIEPLSLYKHLDVNSPAHRYDCDKREHFYFFDLDGETFEHILYYLRNGALPGLHDRNGQRDLIKYSVLRDQARTLGLDKLVNHIEGHDCTYNDRLRPYPPSKRALEALKHPQRWQGRL